MVTKYLVVLLNVVLLVVGASVMTLGIWGMNLGSEISHLIPLKTPSLVMVLGIILVLVSLWGIWTAVNEDPVLMRFVSRLLQLFPATNVIPSTWRPWSLSCWAN